MITTEVRRQNMQIGLENISVNEYMLLWSNQIIRAIDRLSTKLTPFEFNKLKDYYKPCYTWDTPTAIYDRAMEHLEAVKEYIKNKYHYDYEFAWLTNWEDTFHDRILNKKGKTAKSSKRAIDSFED